MTHTGPHRATLALVGALLASGIVPLAAAQNESPLSPLSALFVGDLLVDAEGHVRGQNLAATLTEATGTVSAYSASGDALFRSVIIDGFAQTQRLQGVGSPALRLQGNNAALTLLDDVHSTIEVTTTQATTVRFDLASGVQPIARTAGLMDLTGPGQKWLGSIIAVGADGPSSLGDALAISDGQVIAHAKSSSTILFMAAPRLDASRDATALQRVVVDAASRGELASSFVTDFSGSGTASTQLDVARAFTAQTTTMGPRVETLVGSIDPSPALLSYDLAYESLSVHSANDVAVYVDGALATRAQSAADVRDLAQQGIASYYAVVGDARTQVLASTSDFLGATEHRVSIEASRALTEAQARAEKQADAHVFGDLVLHANGKLTGEFLTGTLGRADALVSSYTTLPTRAEIFSAVKIDDNKQGATLAMDAQHMRVSGTKADLTLVDDAYGTLLLDAKQDLSATFSLAPGIHAVPQLTNLVKLEGAHGINAGTLIAIDNDASRTVSSTLHATDGAVTATLENGARVIYRSPGAGEFTTEAAVAEAIANGRVGAQLLAGLQGRSVASAHAEYFTGVLSNVASHARGDIAVEYVSKIDGARVFVLDTKGAVLAAKSASDVLVLVDGVPAIPVSNAETAFALGTQARSFVETSSNGALRIIVNTARNAGETAHVLIESKLAAAAASTDTAGQFGEFKLFEDGTAVGSFVKLHAESASGAISRFGLVSSQNDVFDSLVAGASSFRSAGLADGLTTLVLENKEARIEVADAASGNLRVVAKQATSAAFQLASGVHPEAQASGIVALKDDAGETLGSLILVGPGVLSVKGQQVSAQLANGQQLVFHANTGVQSELTNAQRTMLDQAIANGRIAGSVLVQTQSIAGSLEASSRGLTSEASDLTTSSVSVLGDVRMVVAATKGRVDVTISSASSAGKTLLLSLDPNSVAGIASGQASVLFDGQAAHEAASLADVLDPEDDAGVAEYFVLAGEAGSKVLVSIPHFSAHTVTLETRSGQAAGSAPIYLYASVFLGLLVAGETALLIRNRRKA
ncbi:MAG: hypothetical protein WDA16_03740 [Candidatus Thermoplasmatota archaeon]